eukprot:scaffold143849_cov15-Prasinocladus_malaysianus.AAC.1
MEWNDGLHVKVHTCIGTQLLNDMALALDKSLSYLIPSRFRHSYLQNVFNEAKQNETKWNGMEWNGMEWNEWNAIKRNATK